MLSIQSIFSCLFNYRVWRIKQQTTSESIENENIKRDKVKTLLNYTVSPSTSVKPEKTLEISERKKQNNKTSATNCKVHQQSSETQKKLKINLVVTTTGNSYKTVFRLPPAFLLHCKKIPMVVTTEGVLHFALLKTQPQLSKTNANDTPSN